MPKYCPENERVKRDYSFFLQAAAGKQEATIDAALRAIERFENSTGRKPFSKFHVEQARSFRAGLLDQTGRGGKPMPSRSPLGSWSPNLPARVGRMARMREVRMSKAAPGLRKSADLWE